MTTFYKIGNKEKSNLSWINERFYMVKNKINFLKIPAYSGFWDEQNTYQVDFDNLKIKHNPYKPVC